jgi:hypothetical protein
MRMSVGYVGITITGATLTVLWVRFSPIAVILMVRVPKQTLFRA